MTFDPGASSFRLRIGAVNIGDTLNGEFELYLKKNSGSYTPITTSSTGGVQSYDASSDADNTPIIIPRLSLKGEDLLPRAITWSPTDKSSYITLSNGNLTASSDNVDRYETAKGATYIPASTKKYWSIHFDSTTWSSWFGVATANSGLANSPTTVGHEFCYIAPGNGAFWVNGSVVDNSNFGGYVVGDRIDIAFDSSAKLLWYRLNNGNWNNNVYGATDPAAGTNGLDCSSIAGPFVPFSCFDIGSCTAQFSSTDWTNSAPDGFSQIDA